MQNKFLRTYRTAFLIVIAVSFVICVPRVHGEGLTLEEALKLALVAAKCVERTTASTGGGVRLNHDLVIVGFDGPVLRTTPWDGGWKEDRNEHRIKRRCRYCGAYNADEGAYCCTSQATPGVTTSERSIGPVWATLQAKFKGLDAACPSLAAALTKLPGGSWLDGAGAFACLMKDSRVQREIVGYDLHIQTRPWLRGRGRLGRASSDATQKVLYGTAPTVDSGGDGKGGGATGRGGETWAGVLRGLDIAEIGSFMSQTKVLLKCRVGLPPTNHKPDEWQSCEGKCCTAWMDRKSAELIPVRTGCTGNPPSASLPPVVNWKVIGALDDSALSNLINLSIVRLNDRTK